MSYFRKEIDAIAGYTPGFQPKEPGFVKLNTNENPYPPSPRAVEAMRAVIGDPLRKYPRPMSDAFRTAAAKVLGTSPDRIMVGNGSDDILNIAVRSFCCEGDPIAWPTPTYSLYDFLAAIQGAKPVRVDWPEDYSLPPELAETGAKLTLLANPNAPTGTMVEPEEVSELARELDGVLLVDEAYVDFAEADCLHLVERHENVIVCRTLSKSYSLAGLRVGYAVAQELLIEGMCKVKDSYNVDSLALAGGTAAIEDQQWLRRNVAKIKATRARMTAALEALGLRCMESHANFVFALAPDGIEAAEIYQRLFERKVLVRYFNLPRVSNGLRISVGSDEEVDRLLAELEQILATVKGETR
jgi:histidinol-phosphate aminotransferase